MFARSAFCDVTPRALKVQLAGYASRQAPTGRVLDPIEVSAVLLEHSGCRCLIFSFDLMIIGAELDKMIRTKLLDRGYASAAIVLLASHTHSAPATDSACERLGIAEPEIVEALAEAAETLVGQIEAQRRTQINLSLCQGRMNHSINCRRRWPFPTFGRTYGFRMKSISMAPNPEGTRNEQATVILLHADDGQVASILWHYTCHPTSVADNVLSADFPGAVRQALRQRFGQVPCIFVQGFCGDVRPNITSTLRPPLLERVRHAVRTIASGPAFARCSMEDSARWRQSLAAAVCAIVQSSNVRSLSSTELQVGTASIPLASFFRGSAPAKPLTTQIVRIGGSLEIIALSAEACIGWEAVLDRALPVPQGRIRLYAGYLGALFGYLPTRAQIGEGGYEVTGFQPLFGLSGEFLSERIDAAVVGCVNDAISDLGHDALRGSVGPRPSADA
jgi:hypothetical protein